MKKFAILFFLIAGSLAIDDIYVYGCTMNLSPNVGMVSNEQLHNCTEAQIFWNYPQNNLTVVFSAPELKPFQVCLLKSHQIYYDILIYHIADKKETLVTKSVNKVCIQSESSTKTVTLKFAAPEVLKYYGIFIDYSVQY